MLYFAYGSNLNHNQMLLVRCKGSKYIKKTFLKNHQLSFCHPNKKNIYGYANVRKKRGSKVPGVIWKITKKHEKILDIYEDFPNSYRKDFFKTNGKKVMFYVMDACSHKKPSQRYLNVVIKGYKDCNLDLKHLRKIICNYPSVNNLIK